jgi:exopolyphosphatase/guanosine-5'-triphosphate,3'-diphosphate pyrophosphatase
MLKIAAIDIGSNAVRMMIAVVLEEEPLYFKKESLIRVPLRLGSDVFSTAMISEKSSRLFVHTMQAFYHMIQAEEVLHVRAFATSAMRDAQNAQPLIQEVFEKTGIQIEVIDGQMEAQVLFNSGVSQELSPEQDYIFIDVGGGSTELNILSGGQALASESFNIGTVRLLQGMDVSQELERMQAWILKNKIGFKQLTAVGTGGNINKTVKMLDMKAGSIIPAQRLISLHAELQQLDIEARIREWSMNPDRAEVIPHALFIYNTVMAAAGCKGVLVPKAGLVDGMVRQIYLDQSAES